MPPSAKPSATEKFDPKTRTIHTAECKDVVLIISVLSH